MLTANGQRGAITIDKSTFTRLGTCEFSGGCAHSIYVGDYGSLTVTRSRFERGQGGHYVKSRAARAIIQNNAFDDTRGQATNYMIDLPAGASGMVTLPSTELMKASTPVSLRICPTKRWARLIGATALVKNSWPTSANVAWPGS